MTKEQINIFEAAAKKLARKKALLSPSQEKAQSTPPQPPKKHRDPEIREMMKKIDDMKQDLLKKMEYLQRTGGLTYEQVRAYMENPKNFTKTEWDKLQQTKNELGDKVWNALGEELKPKAEHVRENVEGERKGKTLGARKRWIPVK